MASQFRHCFSGLALRSYAAKFISTFLFVFVAVGSTISARMLTPDVTSEASSLVGIALAQGFAIFATVYIAADISGGHVNPAVTFGMAVCGHIGFPMLDMVAATLVCLLLCVGSAGQAIPTTRIATEMTGFGGAILESVITFALVYTVYVASGPRVSSSSSSSSNKRGQSGSVVGRIAVGLVASACVLTAGSLTGASMNPARSFGPAVMSGDFKNHGVHWVGPLIGAALAALVHQYLMYPYLRPPSSDTRLGEPGRKGLFLALL